MSRFRLLLLICVLGVGSLLTGCMKGEQTAEDIDVPQDKSSADENADGEENMTNENEAVTETEEEVPRELYLFDESGLVVPQTLDLPKSKSAAMQVMEYLVKDGPITELLPNGFEAVLPAGTEILGVNLEDDGTLIVDVSKEFSTYKPKNELNIIQAMTHSLTQFDSVDKIKLWINGENQTEMPVNNTPLSDGYSRANGINLDVASRPDLQNSEAVTIYYPKQYDEVLQFVPVTKYISKKKAEKPYGEMVKALLNGPSYDIMVKDVFNDNTVLTQSPSVEDNVLQLEFNESILKDKEQQMIADDVMETLVHTMTGQADVESVQVKVENHKTVINESGKEYDHPVSVQDFEGKEKM